MVTLLCDGSTSNTYSRRLYRRCGKPATKWVSLYGVGFLRERDKRTPMCDECAKRTKETWRDAVVAEMK